MISVPKEIIFQCAMQWLTECALSIVSSPGSVNAQLSNIGKVAYPLWLQFSHH